MSRLTFVYTYCDAPGCGLVAPPPLGTIIVWDQQVRDNQERVAMEGWTRKRRKDYCPEHSTPGAYEGKGE